MAAKASLEEYRRKRDFRRTAEPRGERKAKPGTHVFVVQKHAASHLHYDLRLQLDGVMKSWAVPKGPPIDPAERRLAVEVEDHPIEYNDFEGTIPAGEYGGGTVMIWDYGTFEVVGAGDDHDKAMRRSLGKGELDFVFHGERLAGKYKLVRTKPADDGGKPQWLLMKRKDEVARTGGDLTEEYVTSAVSGRTMDEIAEGQGGERVWHSDRGPGSGRGSASSSKTSARSKRKSSGSGPSGDGRSARSSSRKSNRKSVDLSALSPMLASPAGEMPRGDGWTYEPKYDGIRVLALATPDSAALVTRNGHDKAAQFPEIVAALTELSAELERPLVLDGEVVPIVGKGVGRFEALQSRMHLRSPGDIQRLSRDEPATFAAFDLLVDGDDVLLTDEWTERRERLEEVLDGRTGRQILLAETTTDAETLLERARRAGWEGIMAKRTDATYAMGRRSKSWLKVKLEQRQELVVGGFTEPRNSRKHIGSLLLGYYDADGRFIYAGHTGTGFNAQGLADMAKRLKPLARKTPPFESKPKTNEKPHWVTPKVVVEVRFNEWTRDGKLRQPVFLGVRDDKDPTDVVREPVGAEAALASTEEADGTQPAKSANSAKSGKSKSAKSTKSAKSAKSLDSLAFELTNHDKVFFPKEGITKGDLFQYYADMAAYVLPAMEDRPLVLKRFPHGIEGEAFFQQAPADVVPEGIRVEEVIDKDGDRRRRFIGGNLDTLIYTVQLGAISYDPWHSRIQHPDSPDYTIVDLDPGPKANFTTVVEVAKLVQEELETAGLHAVPKTSGSRGIHIYIPLPAGTPLDAATLVAQIIATRVAARGPKIATVERMVKKRPPRAVYVDFLQNILGKTIAGVYAVRARPGAMVSTPLRWDEIDENLDPHELTIRTVPSRVERLGDLWAEGMAAGNSLEKLLSLR